MNIDMELVYGTEDYEELQILNERRKNNYPSGSQNMTERLRNEYIPEIWEVEDEEKDNISNRRKALDRISRILEEVSSDSEEPSISEASFKR